MILNSPENRKQINKYLAVKEDEFIDDFIALLLFKWIHSF